CAGFGDIVWKTSLQGGLFRIGKCEMRAICLITRSDDYAADEFQAATAGLQEVPGSSNVRLKSGKGRAGSGADDRLRAEMKNRIDFVFIDCPQDGKVVSEITRNDIDFADRAGRDQVALWYGVTQQNRDACSDPNEVLREPRAEHARGSCYQYIAVLPHFGSAPQP